MVDFNNCPRCKSDEIGHGYSMFPKTFDAQCYADGCGATAVADSEAECAKKWNSGLWDFRPIGWDEMGSPCRWETQK